MTEAQRAALLAAVDAAEYREGREWSGPSPLGALLLANGFEAWILERWDGHEAIGGGPGQGPTVHELRQYGRLPGALKQYATDDPRDQDALLAEVQTLWRRYARTDVERAKKKIRALLTEERLEA